MILRLNAPKKKVFLICVIAAAVAVVGFIVGLIVLPLISYIAFGVLCAAFVVLMLGNVLKGF